VIARANQVGLPVGPYIFTSPCCMPRDARNEGRLDLPGTPIPGPDALQQRGSHSRPLRDASMAPVTP